MNKLKELLLNEQKIYIVYSQLAEGALNEKEIKNCYTLLKIYGHKKRNIINNLTDREVSKYYIKARKQIENINNGQVNLLDFANYLYYPANEDSNYLILQSIKQDLDLENSNRKRFSENKEIAEFYEKDYLFKKIEKYRDCIYYKKLCNLYENNLTSSFINDLNYIKYMNGFLINNFIYENIILGENIENINMDNIEHVNNADLNFFCEINEDILCDYLENGVEEVENLIQIDNEFSNYDYEEDEFLDNKKLLNLDGTVEEIDQNLLNAIEVDKMFPQFYMGISNNILPYLLKIKNDQYIDENMLCINICASHIETYVNLDCDLIDRKEIIKKLLVSNKNYDKEEYSLSRNLIENMCDNQNVKKKIK